MIKHYFQKMRTAHNYLCMIFFLVIADKLIKISQLLGKQCIDRNLLSCKKKMILFSHFDISTCLFYLWQIQTSSFQQLKVFMEKKNLMITKLPKQFCIFCKYLPAYYVPTGQFLKITFSPTESFTSLSFWFIYLFF